MNSIAYSKILSLFSFFVLPLSLHAQTNILYGKITSKQQVQLGFQIAGTLEKLTVKVGDIVKKGDTIAALHNSIQKIQLSLQKEQLNQANTQAKEHQHQFEKEQQLFEEKVSSESSLDRIRLSLDLSKISVNLAKLQVRLAETNLGYTFLKAPFNGTVIQTFLSEGAYVAPNVPVVHLINTQSLQAELSAPEHIFSKVSEGQTLTAVMDHRTDQKLKLKITKIAPLIRDDRTFRIICDLEDGAGLAPGMSFKTEL